MHASGGGCLANAGGCGCMRAARMCCAPRVGPWIPTGPALEQFSPSPGPHRLGAQHFDGASRAAGVVALLGGPARAKAAAKAKEHHGHGEYGHGSVLRPPRRFLRLRSALSRAGGRCTLYVRVARMLRRIAAQSVGVLMPRGRPPVVRAGHGPCGPRHTFPMRWWAGARPARCSSPRRCLGVLDRWHSPWHASVTMCAGAQPQGPRAGSLTASAWASSSSFIL